MPPLKKILNPASYFRYVGNRAQRVKHHLWPNLKGVDEYPPGHYYSPLIDLGSLGPKGHPAFDGVENWEHVDLRKDEQRAYYDDLMDRFPLLSFPEKKSTDYRYFKDNGFFCPADAFALSGIMRKERPRRIIEVGSGFSTAVTLDTLEASQARTQVTLIEPYPDRLYSLLKESDKAMTTILAKQVQDCPLELFDELEAQDILFIDSSHVAKIGSDVTFLFLRVLPRLKPGVIIHVHDIFYPSSYPTDWIQLGRAWNESLFLRALLVGSPQFEVIAFNQFAACSFPEVFRARFPEFLKAPGGSIWLRKKA